MMLLSLESQEDRGRAKKKNYYHRNSDRKLTKFATRHKPTIPKSKANPKQDKPQEIHTKIHHSQISEN